MKTISRLRDFYQGRRVLVTGHTGFKGSWLTELLLTFGSQVSGLSLPPESTPNHFDKLRHAQRMDSSIGDIRDRSTVDAMISWCQPQIVFHLAAQPLVRASYVNPLLTYETNILGTANVLDVATANASVNAVLCVTSDKCYRKSGSTNDETSPLGGSSPLGASKAAAEMVIAGYQEEDFQQWTERMEGSRTSIASARAGNVIGGGDWTTGRLLPDIVAALRDDRPIELRHPNAIRPWQHVLEALTGYLQLGMALITAPTSHARPFNFGPTLADCVPVSTVVQYATSSYSRTGRDRTRNAPGDFAEQPTLLLDSTLAREQLKWTRVWPVDRAIEATVEWFRRYDSGEPASDLTAHQIVRYMQDHEQAETSIRFEL